MSNEGRNELFGEYQNLIWWTVHRNRTLLAALRVDREDAAQELSICLMAAIEKYNPDKGASLKGFIFRKLQFGILDIKRRHKPCGLTCVKDARPQFVYLDKPRDNGTHYELSA